jgi:hypothetical protein
MSTDKTFKWQSSADGIELVASEPLSEWSSEMKLNYMPALSRLEAAIEEGSNQIHKTNNGYFIGYDLLAELSNHQCKLLGLPGNIKYQLRLMITGSLVFEKTQVKISWHDKSGSKVGGEEVGCLFFDGLEYFKIPSTLYELVKSADAYNEWDGVNLDERLLLISNLKSNLEKITGESISIDAQIKSLKFSHAASVSLDVKVAKDGIDFDPIFFSNDITKFNLENGEQFKEDQSLLTIDDQQVLKKLFKSSDKCKSTYVLDRGHYVFIDPSIRTAVKTIKKYQNSSPEERSRFAKNPQGFIKSALIDEGNLDESADEIVNTSFVETDVFSKRVIEIGLWHPPVLPFVKRAPNTWAPEGFGLKIGTSSYWIDEGRVERLAQEVADAINNKKPSVKLDSDTDLPASEDVLNAINQLLEHVLHLPPVNIEKTNTTENQVEKNSQRMPTKSSQKSILKVQDNFESQDFVAQFNQRAVFDKFEPPQNINSKLKDHQIQGVSWMQECWSLGYPGLLLADDMGLGKTFQTLAFLSWLKEKSQAMGGTQKPVLIVAPITLLGNWKNEAAMHLKDGALGGMALLYDKGLKSYKINSSTKADVVEGRSTLDVASLRQVDWVLTTYETMRDYHISLGLIDFKCVVFDEMQKIKNPASMMTNAAQALHGDFVVGLTGTPIENSLSDIWTLFDTLMPGALGLGDLKRFLEHYSIENIENLKELKSRLTIGGNGKPAPMLRRMKSDVAKDLPRKNEFVMDGVMPDEQAHLYKEAIDKIKSGTFGNSKLEAIHRMRSISLHPKYANSDEIDEPNEFIQSSARLKLVVSILEKIHLNKEKALVFCESLAMQEWLAYYIKERFSLEKYPNRIYGQISAEKRTKIVSDFQERNNNFDVLLLSPKAAGVGITLTAATNVIHLTRWWNPAVEDQCTDRAYRIGQTSNVSVYLPRAIHPLYGEGSFDCILHQLLESKRALSREMLLPPEMANDADYMINQVSANL